MTMLASGGAVKKPEKFAQTSLIAPHASFSTRIAIISCAHGTMQAAMETTSIAKTIGVSSSVIDRAAEGVLVEVEERERRDRHLRRGRVGEPARDDGNGLPMKISAPAPAYVS